MRMTSKIVVVGSCVKDLTSYAPRFPTPGEAIRGTDFKTSFGGKGANQAVAAARLGANVSMVGKVGNDVFGQSTIENFKSNGVNAKSVYVSKSHPTATACITVTASGENSIVVVLGANMDLSVEDIGLNEPLIASAKIVCFQLEIPQEITLEAMKIAKKHNVTTIFNPAPMMENLDMTLLSFSDVICLNKNEAEIILGLSFGELTIEVAKRLAGGLLQLGPKIIILTLGAQGCVLVTSDNSSTPTHIECPPLDKSPVETTGAGDAFVGSLAFFMSNYPQQSNEETVRRATFIASQSVMKYGTQESFPFRAELPETLFQ